VVAMATSPPSRRATSAPQAEITTVVLGPACRGRGRAARCPPRLPMQHGPLPERPAASASTGAGRLADPDTNHAGAGVAFAMHAPATASNRQPWQAQAFANAERPSLWRDTGMPQRRQAYCRKPANGRIPLTKIHGV
jgi:hypothetical protein